MSKLRELGFQSHGPEPESAIKALESRIGVTLPEQYRKHLLISGGGYLEDCMVPCKGPTPFGELNICELWPLDDILSMIESDIIPRSLLFIGAGHLGKGTCISIAGIDHGKVYAFDSEMRYYWTQDEIDARPYLVPSIVEFFQLRDDDELPERPFGYENCYEVADSFDEFIEMLTRLD